MEVRQTIDELRTSLDLIIREDELLAIIDVQLHALRQSFPTNRSTFTPNDIEFLKSLGNIRDDLQEFIELKAELPGVKSLKDWVELRSRLTRAKGSLAPFPVAKRIAKEIRELDERRPAILELDKAQRLSRLEQNAPRCPRHHPMVIRDGINGRFWGCSQYPSCTETAQLAPREKGLLAN